MNTTATEATQLEGSARDRQIVAARVIVTCPGRNFVTQLAARFPYAPKQLPIARLEDGSMWDW